MWEHYSMYEQQAKERHAELMLEASRYRMMPRRRSPVICTVCRTLGKLLVRMGNSLLKVTVDAFETAR